MRCPFFEWKKEGLRIKRVLWAKGLFLVLAVMAGAFGMGGAAQAASVNDGFNPDPNGLVSSIAVQADGKILVGGDFTAFGLQTRNYIARLNTDGTVDATFDPNANGPVIYVAAQADGKILVGGEFTTIGGQTRNRIARLNADGTVDVAFNPDANGIVDTIAVQADGKILVGGEFTTIGGQTRYYT
jgi:uncharacterized delta-60 repeat protein